VAGLCPATRVPGASDRATTDTFYGVPITVVAAVIERDESFLLTLRPAGTHLEGRWEFPGGQCYPHETHIEALRRELHEELDIVADVGELVQSITHTYPEKTVELHFYRCGYRGEPKPMLGQEMRWVKREDLTSLAFPDADAQLIRLLSSPGGRASREQS
jgi:8-oxo-dGTP diphosphatase